eukprot:9630656-Alexandrium_andersonii.AAC.1
MADNIQENITKLTKLVAPTAPLPARKQFTKASVFYEACRERVEKANAEMKKLEAQLDQAKQIVKDRQLDAEAAE